MNGIARRARRDADAPWPRAASLPPTSADAGASAGIDPATPRWLMPLARALARANRHDGRFGMLALLAASFVLTSSVVTRYFFKASTDWQDEAAVFLLVGATFLCGAFVQSIRGHVGIEAVADAAVAARSNRVRARRWSTALPRVLRLLRVEVVDAAARGLGRRPDDLVVVGAAALDPLPADVAGHDAAERCSCCVHVAASVNRLRAISGARA